MAERPRASRLEVAATVLLAVAAVATGWSSYQANRGNGEQAKAASATNAIRIDAARAQGLSQAETEVDVATFIQWVDADRHDDEVLADFYEARFREEFQPAFDAWLATDPFDNPDAPPTPFAMPEYQVEAAAEAATSTSRPRSRRRRFAATSSARPTTCWRSCSSPWPSSSPGSA